MSGIGGIGRPRAGEGGGIERELVDRGEAPGAEALAFAGLDLDSVVDVVDGAEAIDEAARAAAEALARLAGRPRTVDDALAAPPPEHLARTLDAGRANEALARVVRRGARPGETLHEARLRQLVARVLDLRHETAAGMGKVSVG